MGVEGGGRGEHAMILLDLSGQNCGAGEPCNLHLRIQVEEVKDCHAGQSGPG